MKNGDRDGGKDILLPYSLLFLMNGKQLSYLAVDWWDFWTDTNEGRVWWVLARFSQHIEHSVP